MIRRWLRAQAEIRYLKRQMALKDEELRVLHRYLRTFHVSRTGGPN